MQSPVIEYKSILMPNGTTNEIKITTINCEESKNNSRTSPINIIFCLPGNKFSGRFLQCWTKLLTYCVQNGINCEILQMSSSNVYHVRECFVSQAVISPTPNVKPFTGKKYDYVMWIDSDQIFDPNDLEKLIADDVDIVSGAIRVVSGEDYAFGWYDIELMQNRNELRRAKVHDIEGKKELIEVDFMGFAFTLVKYGVFESIRFPYFEGLPYSSIPGFEGLYGQMGEDLSCFYKLQKKGFKCYIDPTVRILHEKEMTI